MSKQEKYDTLLKTARHLNIAIGEFSKICGSSYVGSLREFKHMVKAKLLLDGINEKLLAGVTVETNKAARKDPKLVKAAIDKLLLASLGKPSYVELWWVSPNKSFDNRKPVDVFNKNPDAVVNYVMQHCSPGYSYS